MRPLVLLATSMALGTAAAASRNPVSPAPPAANLRGADAPSCSVYTNGATNCADSKCSSCFNAGGRPGVKCESGGVGYYCAADATPGATFACMDWSFGSTATKAAEKAFTDRTGERVFLGVGTYGVDDDAQRGLGNCYRMTVEGVDRDIIAQVRQRRENKEVGGRTQDLHADRHGHEIGR
jgi:hypothetical protein